MKHLFFILLFALTFVAHTSFAEKAGNGQLIVEVEPGKWVPIEAALANDTRLYRGIENLPDGRDGNGEGPQFNKDYVVSLNKWLALLDRYSPDQADLLREAGKTADIVYVNRLLVFVPENYPRLPVEYQKQKPAAIYYKGRIFVSIPNMELMGDLNGLTKKDHQGFVLLHELINVVYVDPAPKYSSLERDLRSTENRLRMGQAILEIKTRGLTSVKYLVETALEYYSFWRSTKISPLVKIDVMKELRHLNRKPWIVPVSAEAQDFVNLRQLLIVAQKGETFETLIKNDDDFIKYTFALNLASIAGIRIKGSDGNSFPLLLESFKIPGSIRKLYAKGSIQSLSLLSMMLRKNKAYIEELKNVRHPRTAYPYRVSSDGFGEGSLIKDVLDTSAVFDEALKELSNISLENWTDLTKSWLDPITLKEAQNWEQVKDYNVEKLVKLQSIRQAYEAIGNKPLPESLPLIKKYVTEVSKCNVKSIVMQEILPKERTAELAQLTSHYQEVQKKVHAFCREKTGRTCRMESFFTHPARGSPGDYQCGTAQNTFMTNEKEVRYFMVMKTIASGWSSYDIFKVQFKEDKKTPNGRFRLDLSPLQRVSKKGSPETANLFFETRGGTYGQQIFIQEGHELIQLN
ncbi:MAG: hypothetical protein AB7F59_12850 [Bdellovibrionales bacterium]